MVYVVIGVIVVLVLAIVGFVISTYNSLARLRNSVKNQWSQIDIQLKRRFDLIPNLVETVKGYAKHEKDTLENVIKARNSYQSSTTQEEALSADTELTKSISKLFALAEDYPELKANENFVGLQNDLEETENKISFARQFYSDAVMKYNNAIQMFPSNIVAGMFGFTEEKFFEAVGAERENVKVEF